MFAIAGQCFHVACGRLRVSAPPRWLGERMVVSDLELSRGASYVMSDPGWLQLAAHESTTLRLV